MAKFCKNSCKLTFLFTVQMVYKCILKRDTLHFAFTFIHFAEAIIQSDLKIIILYCIHLLYSLFYILLYYTL